MSSNIIPFPIRHPSCRSLAPMSSRFAAPSAVIHALALTEEYVLALLILSGSDTLSELEGKTEILPGCTVWESAARQFGGAFTLN